MLKVRIFNYVFLQNNIIVIIFSRNLFYIKNLYNLCIFILNLNGTICIQYIIYYIYHTYLFYKLCYLLVNGYF